MSDINDKYRPELKSYFIAYAIPTQQNFEDFIDAMIIQGEDPIAVTPDSPVMIRTSGADETRDEFIHFYEDFDTEDAPTWILAKNPGGGDEGFEIADSGATRLFIGEGNGCLGINTASPRGQLDVRIANNNDDTAPLVIGQDQVNYLSVSSLKDNAKVIIGRQSGDFTGNEAKLHVTLDDDNVGDGIYPLMIENATDSNEYFFIRNNGQVGINADEDYLDSDSDTILNVHGNIKAGSAATPFYLKNDTGGHTVFMSTMADKWLKLVSKSSLAFWAGSVENQGNAHLLIKDDGKTGVGFDEPNASLAVNGDLYVGSDDSYNLSGNTLAVDGNAIITGHLNVTGGGEAGTNLTIDGSGIKNTSGQLVLFGEDGIDLQDRAIVIESNKKVTIKNDLYLEGNLFVDSYQDGKTAIDFTKLDTIQYIDFRTGFISMSGKNSSSSGTATVSFDSDVIRAEASIKSWKVGYSSGDEHIREAHVQITNVRCYEKNVEVTVSSVLADKGYDNDWKAEVTVMVIAVVNGAV